MPRKKPTSTQDSFAPVFAAERNAIRRRRATLGLTQGEQEIIALPNYAGDRDYQPSELFREIWQSLQDGNENWEQTRDAENIEPGLIGVALSGGGIRSSTFNLGVLQAIHRVGLFPYIDYLSTVSGGGYIGTYLTTTIKKLKASAGAIVNGCKSVFPFAHEMGKEEPDEFRHLRNYSNFLAPNGRHELLSIPLVLLRGLIVNALVVVPVLALFGLLLGFLIEESPTSGYHYLWSDYFPVWFGAAGVLLTGLVLIFAAYPGIHYYRVRRVTRGHTEPDTESTARELRAQTMRALRWYLSAILVFFFIELQPYVLGIVDRWLESFGPWLLGGAVSALPFADKLVYGLSKFKALLGAGFYGLLGILLLWGLMLWFTLQAVPFDGAYIEQFVIEVRLLADELFDANLWSALLTADTWFNALDAGQPLFWLALIGGVGYYGFKTVDVNSTSIHKYYRDHLVKAFVAQAADDDLVAALPLDQRPDEETPVPRLSDMDTDYAPYHLINVALNAEREAEELRYRSGRHSSFFFFGKAYCGGIRTGYIETEKLETVATDLDVGTAMAVSGAAVAPNMGKLSNPFVAVILAILNIRLNHWLHNPKRILDLFSDSSLTEHQRDKRLRRLSGKRVGPLYLLREMFQTSDVNHKFVNLSDGGHIENLGVYELLRRQCRLIIVGDGERDSSLSFHGLSEVIRLARIDFGFNIQMAGLDEIRSGEQQHAVGTIRYSETRTGKLLYIKSNLGGDHNLQATLQDELYRSSPHRNDNSRFDDNPYVAHYQSSHPEFPHETTADQFFDETQFESYRALGYSVGAKTLIAPWVPERTTAEEV